MVRKSEVVSFTLLKQHVKMVLDPVKKNGPTTVIEDETNEKGS